MKIRRRQFLCLAAGATVLPVASGTAWAQNNSARPVRLIVGFAAGGGADITARLIGQSLSERLGQPFIIENRPGAGTNLAAETVVKAAPDGHTLLLVVSATTIGATLYSKLSFNLISDIAPVAGISRTPLVMEVNPAIPAKTIPEFIAYARANPRKLSMASAGIGSTQHLAGELFKMMTGVDMVHVPYRGSAPALADLLGGQVQVMFDTTSASIEHIKSGRLRPLAVTSAERADALPELSTVGEFVPGYEATAMVGIGAPKDTPTEVIDKLNQAINAALADAKIKARLADLGGPPLAGSPADFGRLMAAETEKWGKVVRFSGAKAE